MAINYTALKRQATTGNKFDRNKFTTLVKQAGGSSNDVNKFLSGGVPVNSTAHPSANRVEASVSTANALSASGILILTKRMQI